MSFLHRPELAAYFDPNNLIFEGMSREDYIREGSLPDGFYTICFKAVDYDRFDTGDASLTSCTNIQAIRYDPPVILSPIGEQLVVQPQNMTVQWQPRHTGFPTEYLVQIFQMDSENGLTPDLILSSTQPYVEKVVMDLTSLQVDVSDPVLQWGKDYIIRVQAKDLTMNHTFTNDGWSDPRFFTYGAACDFPGGIEALAIDHESAKVAWIPQPGFNKYVVKYRVKGQETNWYEEETLDFEPVLKELEDATVYEYQVQTLCKGNQPG